FSFILLSQISLGSMPVTFAQEESESSPVQENALIEAPSESLPSDQLQLKKKPVDAPPSEEKPIKEIGPIDEEGGMEAMSMMSGGSEGVSNMTQQAQNIKRFGLDDHELINQSFVNLLSGSAEVRLPLQVPNGINGLT